MRRLGLILILGACGQTVAEDNSNSVITAQPYIGLEEKQHRKEIRELTGVDPIRTEWCAAFVNAVLEIDGIPGSDSVSNHPLTARSFLYWGERIERDDIKRGDVVVFPRGDSSWQGHVGFYVETQNHNGKDWWVILGGNQDNTVSYDLFDPRRAIGIRREFRPTDVASIERKSIIERLRN